ncbi:DUF2235 domain-containing protein [Bradyrhizobium sediminis]|uniref:DUF2235 domain-containing protein n=1 Tax=Bradyrhizobium sediminis TaxID=2840469 RepID=A0A975NEM9_9BRAD|nr:DUF2235 domain-containing protein [Bradyrhizobium sediminis]QWG13415.1 DUF2235 domain-containing protein [Bradyrhizobium sediminis]
MSRNIVLLSDGTGNSAAKVWRTNVWRTFEALDLSDNDQVAFYDDGVGTSSFKPLAVLGGAFGFGLKRNVIDIYKFACRNYRDEDDRLFGFGFSRGAFTIRVVIGLILNQGLVTAQDEAELDKKAHAAYRQYRRERYHTVWHIEDLFRWIRDLFLPKDYDKADNRPVSRVSFVGVWDTVAAYGMPLDEMTRGISRYIWPLELPNHALDRDRVMRACQALALDEERTTFHPELWDERVEPPGEFDPDKERFIKDEQISQVWFAGVHSNVGGGYPDDTLAYIPFVWMITEAQRCGLKFKSDAVPPPAVPADPDTFKNAVSKRDKDGRLYDPRQGLGGYYRYGPRKLVQLCNYKYSKNADDQVVIERPKIHEAVFRRISNHTHAYAPVGLPPVYDVVKENGAIVTPVQYGFETDNDARLRADAQEHIWNEIWKRRIVYFATVAATLWLFAFPLLRSAPRSDEYSSPIRWVSDIIRIVGNFLPGFAETWINGFARSPGQFVALLLLVAGLTWLGARIASRISDRMGAIWRGIPVAPPGLPDNWIYRLRSSPYYIALHEGLKRRWAPAFFAALFVYLGVTFASHLLYNVQDVAGWTCVEDGAAKGLARGEKREVEFVTSNLCNRTGVFVEGNGAKYHVEIKATSPWRDGGIPSELGGFYTTDAPAWHQRVALMLGGPLRRELTRPWFRLVLRYGATGGEEVFLDPDPEDGTIEEVIRPTRKGELFVFVNDAVIGIPGLCDFFYRNNEGAAKLTITRR